ncbi:hypothetical protein QFZ91_002270 [Paraburkholderia sp. JPY419]
MYKKLKQWISPIEMMMLEQHRIALAKQFEKPKQKTP